MTVAAFWDWALRQYAREPTQALLLTLQSQADLVILEALFAAWLSTEGHRLEEPVSYTHLTLPTIYSV